MVVLLLSLLLLLPPLRQIPCWRRVQPLIAFRALVLLQLLLPPPRMQRLLWECDFRFLLALVFVLQERLLAVAVAVAVDTV